MIELSETNQNMENMMTATKQTNAMSNLLAVSKSRNNSGSKATTVNNVKLLTEYGDEDEE